MILSGMKRLRLPFALLFFILYLSTGEAPHTAPALTWARAYGGKGDEEARAIQPTFDGGYIVAGSTLPPGADTEDLWLIRLDPSGNILWQKAYGGKGGEEAESIQQTTYGGFLVSGFTSSFGAGSLDAWVLTLDAKGNIIRQRAYGGKEAEVAHSIVQTSDGDFLVAGSTSSFGAGSFDAWALKLDEQGKTLRQFTLGGTRWDDASSIRPTPDGGYVMAGLTESSGAGSTDVWLLKLNSKGMLEWQKTYGGSQADWANAIQPLPDGGFILAGSTRSFGSGSEDLWLIRLDPSGNILWQKAYGGRESDGAYSIHLTADGGFITAGETRSFGAGSLDAWVLKLDASGNLLWQKTYGGSASDWAYSIQPTFDGGYIVAGSTRSFGSGSLDAWILKLDENGNIANCSPRDLSAPSTAEFINTSATPVDTSFTPLESTAKITHTTAISSPSTAVVQTQCKISSP